MDDRDTKGDVYEYMLGKLATSGTNGQFRTPRHIIRLMVEMMTPTPKETMVDPAAQDEVDHNTYRRFTLEDGVPTDEYSLDDAIKYKFLVPPRAVSVPLKFQREKIKYNELPEEEKDRWDALEWDEESDDSRTR